jgi:hypothetical protein
VAIVTWPPHTKRESITPPSTGSPILFWLIPYVGAAHLPQTSLLNPLDAKESDEDLAVLSRRSTAGIDNDSNQLIKALDIFLYIEVDVIAGGERQCLFRGPDNSLFSHHCGDEAALYLARSSLGALGVARRAIRVVRLMLADRHVTRRVDYRHDESHIISRLFTFSLASCLDSHTISLPHPPVPFYRSVLPNSLPYIIHRASSNR